MSQDEPVGWVPRFHLCQKMYREDCLGVGKQLYSRKASQFQINRVGKVAFAYSRKMISPALSTPEIAFIHFGHSMLRKV